MFCLCFVLPKRITSVVVTRDDAGDSATHYGYPEARKSPAVSGGVGDGGEAGGEVGGGWVLGPL